MPITRTTINFLTYLNFIGFSQRVVELAEEQHSSGDRESLDI